MTTRPRSARGTQWTGGWAASELVRRSCQLPVAQNTDRATAIQQTENKEQFRQPQTVTMKSYFNKQVRECTQSRPPELTFANGATKGGVVRGQ